MKKEWKFIGLDVGAESGRCVAAILSEGKLSLNEMHRFETHCLKNDNGFFWDIYAIYDEILRGLSASYKAFGPDFDGISVDTWGVDYVLIDSNAVPLSDAFHYRDNRTDNIMEKAFQIVSRETLYKRTGSQFAQYNTLFQLLAEKERKPNVLKSADKFLMMPDFFNFMLSGIKKTEYSIASTTSLTDPRTRNWSRDIIKAFGLPESIFPEMIEPGTKLGNILPGISEKTGLNADTPVFASAGHDTASAIAAIPALGNEPYVFLSSGTWSLMGTELHEPLIKSETLKYNFTNEGGVFGTVRFLKNIIGLWLVQECRRSWIESGMNFNYSQIADIVRKEGLVNSWINLNDNRFLKPGNMPEKVISYLKETGQRYKEEPGFISAVIFESIAFTYRQTFNEIKELTGMNITKIHAVGGGIQNSLLTQYASDATGVPVFAGPVEASISGNIGMQALASGAVSGLQNWRSIIESSFGIHIYNPHNADYFNRNEDKFLNIISERK